MPNSIVSDPHIFSLRSPLNDTSFPAVINWQEGMPVCNQKLSFRKHLKHGAGNNVKLLIIVTGVAWIENLKPFSNRKVRTDKEDCIGKSFVLPVLCFIDDRPSSKHCHNNSFATSCGH